jgi:hypothetical protein
MATPEEARTPGAFEHQEALRRLAEQPAVRLPERRFTPTMLGGPPIPVSTRRWLRRHPADDDDADGSAAPSGRQAGSPSTSTAFQAFHRYASRWLYGSHANPLSPQS